MFKEAPAHPTRHDRAPGAYCGLSKAATQWVALVALGVFSWSSLLPAYAQHRPPFYCSDMENLPSFFLSAGELTINNFQLSEHVGFASERPYARVSFTLVNRAPDTTFASAQVAGLGRDPTDIILALSGEPSFGASAGHSTETLTIEVNVEKGEVARVHTICARLDGGT